MFNKSRKVVAIGVIAAFLGACQSTTGENLVTGENVGMVGGAALGGFLGSKVGDGTGQMAAIAAGTLLGAWAGGALGRRLSPQDQQMAATSAQNSFEYEPIGTTSSWQNPQSGNQGSFTPTTSSYEARNGQTCRKYQSTVVIEGRTEYADGIACKQADGSWRIVQ